MLAGGGLGAASGHALALPALKFSGVGFLLGATSRSLADRVLRSLVVVHRPADAARHDIADVV